MGRQARLRNGRSNLAHHLAHLRADQAVRRRKLYAQTQCDEVAAISRLAAQLWGDGRRRTPNDAGAYGGCVEFDNDPITRARMGVWKVGFFLDPPHPKGFDVARRRRIMFQGASYAEIFSQVLLWKERRS